MIYEYDSLDRLISTTQPLGIKTSYGYDDNGNCTSVTDPNRQKTSYTYDSLNRVTSAVHGEGSKGQIGFSYQYDPLGNLVKVTQTGATTGASTRTYDERNRLKRAADIYGHWIEYQYDAADNITTTADDRNYITGYEYDDANRLSAVVTPNGSRAAYDWLPNGLLKEVRYPTGMLRQYGYDDAGRVTTIRNQAGGDIEESGYGYDPASNRSSETKKYNGVLSRSIAYHYDDRDRLDRVEYTDSIGKGLKGEYFQGVDLTDLKATRIDPQVNFNWIGSRTPDESITGEEYSARWSGQIEPNNTDRYTFITTSDEGVRLWVDNQLVIDDWESHTEKEDSGSVDLEAGRKYDIKLEYYDRSGDGKIELSWAAGAGAREVIPAKNLYAPSSAVEYRYDAAGNRLGETGIDLTGVSVNRTYEYDDLNRLKSITGDRAGATSFEYDDNGNLKKKTRGTAVTQYEYDARDQLKSVLEGDRPAVSYEYDYSRRRIAKTGSGLKQKFVYDGDRLISEYSEAQGSDALVNRYDYGTDLLRGELGGEGERWYFHDGLGSVTALGSAGSGVVSRNEYGAWGELISGGTGGNHFGYTGQYLDEETGMMALGNGERYYEPGLGRFIQQDWYEGNFSDPITLNRYAYANSSPLVYVDPTGHSGESLDSVEMALRRERREIERRTDGNSGQVFRDSMVVGVKQTVYGGLKGAYGLVSEPFLLIHDGMIAAGGAALDIDAEYLEFKSSTAKWQREQFLSGKSRWEITKGTAYGVSTLGLGPAVERVGGALFDYVDGRIDIDEFNERTGPVAGEMTAPLMMAKAKGTAEALQVVDNGARNVLKATGRSLKSGFERVRGSAEKFYTEGSYLSLLRKGWAEASPKGTIIGSDIANLQVIYERLAAAIDYANKEIKIGGRVITDVSEMGKILKESAGGEHPVLGPYFKTAKILKEIDPEFFFDPEDPNIKVVEGDALKKARRDYKEAVANGKLQPGHHQDPLALNGGNVQNNLIHTGESTIGRGRLELLDLDFYKNYGNPDALVLKIHKPRPDGLYIFGNNPRHTLATIFQNMIIRWQRKEGVRRGGSYGKD